MKHILKALNNQLKLIQEDLDWHKHELNEYRSIRVKDRKAIEDLKEEKDVLMKEIERLKNQ
jgi:hypothetical protein